MLELDAVSKRKPMEGSKEREWQVQLNGPGR